MSGSFKYAIGIDIGGTKIAIGLVNAEGCLVASSSLPTESRKGLSQAVHRIDAHIKTLLSAHGLTRTDIKGVGVGCPGPLDLKTGVVHNPYTLPGWEGESLVDHLQSVLGIQVILENDADVALLGECWKGAGSGMDPVVMLTFGTGVGGSVLARGQIYRGMGGEHPEIGLIPVLPDMPADYSGVQGSLESLASGSGIAKQGKVHGLHDAESVFNASKEGHSGASKIVDNALRGVGIAGWTLAHTFFPECIILGGGLMDHHFQAYSNSIRSHLKRATLLREQTIIVSQAKLGNEAGMVGAAGLWLKYTSMR